MYVTCNFPSSGNPLRALMIPDDVQSIVSIVHSQSHYAVLHFDLDQKLVNVYDGLQLPKQTWDHCHIDQIVTQIEKDEDNDHSKWNVVLPNSITCKTDVKYESIDIQQNDGFNCGPIAAVCLWAIYDFRTCLASVEGRTPSDFWSVVTSHLIHLLEKHDSLLQWCIRHKALVATNNIQKQSIATNDESDGVTVERKRKSIATTDDNYEGKSEKGDFESVSSEALKLHNEDETKWIDRNHVPSKEQFDQENYGLIRGDIGISENVENDVFVSPTRRVLRDKAFSSLNKAAKKMKLDAEAKDSPIKVGDVVNFSVEDIDRNKTDAGTLTVVVIGIEEYKKNGPLYRVASARCPLKERMHRNKLTVVPIVTPELMGLKDVWQSHEGMAEISVRQALSHRSLHGRQGMRRCDCKGDCQTNRCSCFKSGQKCNSRCHRKNCKCTNRHH